MKNQSVFCHFGFGSPQGEFLCLQPFHGTLVRSIAVLSYHFIQQILQTVKDSLKNAFFFQIWKSFCEQTSLLSTICNTIFQITPHNRTWHKQGEFCKLHLFWDISITSPTWVGRSGSAPRYWGNSGKMRGIVLSPSCCSLFCTHSNTSISCRVLSQSQQPIAPCEAQAKAFAD